LSPPNLFPGYLGGSVSMALIVASIEHEAASPPHGLPDDMEPLPGASLRFLSIKSIDGFKVQAALWQPEKKPPAETTIIVQVHGSGGNLASFPLRAIARALSARGYAALSISTRQHDQHVNTDNFFDVRRDIEAAVVTRRRSASDPSSSRATASGQSRSRSMPPATGTLRSKPSSRPARSGSCRGSRAIS
jgi:hypothetical protein